MRYSETEAEYNRRTNNGKNKPKRFNEEVYKKIMKSKGVTFSQKLANYNKRKDRQNRFLNFFK